MQAILNTLAPWQVATYFVLLVLFLAWEGIEPFFGFFRGKNRDRTFHVGRNLLLGLVNSAAVALVFVALWLTAAIWAEENGYGILNFLTNRIGLPDWAHIVGAILLLDLWTYTWHRLNHRVSFFWRFHRVHHSDTRMDVSTASRFHIGEIIMSSTFRIPVIVLFGAFAWELVLYETMMFTVVQFHHANIAVPSRVDRWLRMLIVTPGMHKVHHSRIKVETDSNYSAFLSVWDRIGRSFRISSDPSQIQFGLDEYSQVEADSIPAIMAMPLNHKMPDHDPPASLN